VASDWLDLVPELAMFPLGSPLFPHMPLRLQVFEPRYLQMLAELIEAKKVRFGVVLIERGPEVGGGEQRFDVGTVAEVTDLDAQDGLVRLVAHGGSRFRVRDWLADAPYPRAEVVELAELEWPADQQPLRDQAEQLVRRTLAKASEFADDLWPSDIALSDDPVAAAWQLAAIAPLTALDQHKLLGATSMVELLSDTLELTREAAAGYG
jgi:Lon protease-like protein